MTVRLVTEYRRRDGVLCRAGELVKLETVEAFGLIMDGRAVPVAAVDALELELERRTG